MMRPLSTFDMEIFMTLLSLRRSVLGAVVALAVAPAAIGPAVAQTLSLGEQFALRGYTGLATGKAMATLLKAPSIGLLSNDSSICSSLTGAIVAGYLDASKPAAAPVSLNVPGVSINVNPGTASATDDADPVRVAALAKPEDAAAAVARMTDRAAVGLIFGGQRSLEDNQALTTASLKALAAANYPGAVFLHVRVWAPQLAQKAAAADPEIARYLAGKNNVFTATVDPQAGEVSVRRVSVTPEAQKSEEVVAKIPMGRAWAELFRRSI